MPFVKFELPAKPAKEQPQIRIGTLGFSIQRSALEKFHLADASHVDLWFDDDAKQVAITKTDAHNKSAFKAKPRGKSGDTIFIAATKFYSAFGIAVTEKNATSSLETVDGKAAFTLPGGKTNAATKEYTGAKRGRKPKGAE